MKAAPDEVKTEEQTQKSSCADTDKEIDRITRINKVKSRQVVRQRGRQLQAETDT